MKKLYRSRDTKIVGGVLGGISEYFQIDPIIVRIVFLILLVLTKAIPVLIMYALLVIIVPIEPDVVVVSNEPTKE